MKRIYTIILSLAIALAFGIGSVQAQVVDVCAGNDSVVLKVGNFRYGYVQWQVSEDNELWSDIDGAIDTIYRFLPERPQYYRASVRFPACADITYFSQVTFVQMPPKAFAGPDRIVPAGTMAWLKATPVDDAEGEWHIIHGVGGQLQFSHDPCSGFMGEEGEYQLTWTVTNACGSNTDTVTVKCVPMEYQTDIVIVDETDVILSDSTQRLNGEYIVSFNDPVPDIHEGSVLLGYLYPSFLRKVVSFEREGNMFTMQTVAGTLTDVVMSGAFSFDPVLYSLNKRMSEVKYLDRFPTRKEMQEDPSLLRDGSVYVIKDAVKGNTGNDFDVETVLHEDNSLTVLVHEFDFNCFDQQLDGLKYSCEFNLNPHFDANLVFANGDFSEARIGMYDASVELVQHVRMTKPIDTDLWEKDGRFNRDPMIVSGLMVGMVPTYLMLDFGYLFEVEASTQALMEFTKTTRNTFTFEMSYNALDGQLESRQEKGTPYKEMTGTDPTGSFRSVFMTGIKASVLLADVFGPYFAVDGNLNPSVCTSAQTGDKVGNLSMGTDADLGCRFQLFSDHQALQDRSLDMNLMSHHEPAPKKVLKLNGDNQVYTFGQYLPNPVSVKVTGWFGVPMNDAKVHFEAEKGDVSEAVVTTDQQGVATTRWRPGTPTGMDRLRVKVYDCDGNLTGETPQTFRAYTSSTDPCLQSNLTVEAYLVTENTIVPMVSGGRKPYRYSIDGLSYSSTQPSVTVQPGHDYHFYVLDANGCEAEALYNAAPYNCDNSMMQLSAVVSGNVITATASGGRAPYHYSIGGSYQSSGVFSGLLDGEYRVTVRDASGCERSKQVVVSHQGNLEVSISEIEGGAGTACVVTSTTTLAERGVCWSSHHTPTVQDFHTSYGTGSGDYDFTLTTLNPQVTYYVRAYALDASGTSYSREVCINPSQGLSMPVVVATGITCVAGTTAIGSGNVTYDGGAEVTERGICYGTGHLPGASGIHLVCGAGLGAFTMNITGLTPNTTYYARAYATNSQGTTYGNEVEFTTGDSDGGEVPEGAINGLFSVAPDYQVYFSKGNLQYQPSTNTWRFAENQYDMLHPVEELLNYDEEMATYYCDVSNEYTGSFTGWIELFGWGTSGYNHGAVCYQPWSVSQNDADYMAYGNATNSLNDQTGQADWGYNAISNGGNQEHQWYTLSREELTFLFNSRNTASGARYAKAKVNGVDGVIVLPDDWQVSIYALNNVNNQTAGFSSNIISISDWVLIEEAGAVFMPALGARIGTRLYNLDAEPDMETTIGEYWSSSFNLDIDDGRYPYTLYFDEKWLTTSDIKSSFGCGVRLVHAGQGTLLQGYSPWEFGPTGGGTGPGHDPITTESYWFYGYPCNGSCPILEKGACWSTSPNPTLADNHIAGEEGTEYVKGTIHGLTPNTTYYLKMFVSDSLYTYYSDEIVFTTDPLSVPELITFDAIDVTSTSAVLGGVIQYDGGSPIIKAGICWDTNPNPVIACNHLTADLNSGVFELNVTGLDPSTTYYVRAYATNGVGTAYGNEVSFTTLSDGGGAVSWEIGWTYITDVTTNSLYFVGGASNGTGPILDMGVCWSQHAQPTMADEYVYGPHYWSEDDNCEIVYGYIYSLIPNTTYYLRFFVTDSIQTSYSEDVVVVTLAEGDYTPQVVTMDITDITSTSAQSGCQIIDDGGAGILESGICWSTHPNPIWYEDNTYAGGSYCIMSELSPNTTYYVRAYAHNIMAEGYGNEVIFTTLPEGGDLQEYVDLGLPSGTLWATCNVGANAPESSGSYFAWGETQTKNGYFWDNYQHCNGSENTLTKYCNNPDLGYNGYVDELIVLESMDDAATVNWGDEWCMPTTEQWEELCSNTTYSIANQNGVDGALFTAPNGNAIFFPYGEYWASSLFTNNPVFAYIGLFTSAFYDTGDVTLRYLGRNVRPVRSNVNGRSVRLIHGAGSGSGNGGGGRK